MHYEANGVTLNGNLSRLLSTGARVFKKAKHRFAIAQSVFRGPALLLGALFMATPSPVSVITAFAVLGLSLMLATESLSFDEKPNVAEKSAGTATDAKHREICVKVLQPLGVLVGEWKGVGQPKRGSNAGAWSEKAHSAWKFDEKASGLFLSFELGKQYQSALFSVAKDGTTPELSLVPAGGERIHLTRKDEATAADSSSKEEKDVAWVFESSSDALPQTRCTVRIISDIRFAMLFEEKPTAQGSYRRLSEIGLTRVGARLASGNTGERQCIVTGGLGTIKVSHGGKTYYVCCEGCQQAFDADPVGTIAAYQERLKEASKK
jgi:hypothetical protein